MGAMWNPQATQMAWFMEQQGYLSMRVMHDWLFVKRDSEYASGAQEVVQDVSRRLAQGKLPAGTIEKFHNPFNQ